MTPYGIVYKENLRALQESVTVWQKKFGVLKLGFILKIDAVITLIMVVAMVISYFIEPDIVLTSTLLVFTVIADIGSYFILKNSFIKETTRVNFQNTDKQIVLFEEKIEYTTPVSKGEYYYDELVFAYEKNGIITLLIDEASMPCSVCAHEMKKGDFSKFAHILREKMGAKYIFEGGRM